MGSLPAAMPAGGGGPPAARPRRLRVLCLHGFRTSGAIMKDQVRERRRGVSAGRKENRRRKNARPLGARAPSTSTTFFFLPPSVSVHCQLDLARLPRDVGDLVDFDTLDAPNRATGPPPPDVPWAGPFYEWWDARRDEASPGGWVYEGGDAAFAALGAALRTADPPYDGLLGFSQGTILASLALAVFQERAGRGGGGGGGGGSPSPGPLATAAAALAGVAAPPRFALLYCGVFAKPPMCDILGGAAGRDGRRLACPSLHVIGGADPIAPLSRRLAGAFVNPVVLEHGRGHVMPALPPEGVATLRAFLEARLVGSSL